MSVAGSGRRRLYLTASALVLLLVACFIVFWGPLSKDSSPRAVRDGSASEAGAKGARKQKAASAPGAVELDRGNGGVAAATAPAPATQQAATTPPVSDAAAPPAATAGDTVRVTEAQGPAPTAPPPQRVNGPPTVSISGPTQVMARQTATYTACISDPDGDAVSTNWGGSSLTRSWSAPGLYAVSVTVTDSSGLSASASISVRVI